MLDPCSLPRFLSLSLHEGLSGVHRATSLNVPCVIPKGRLKWLVILRKNGKLAHRFCCWLPWQSSSNPPLRLATTQKTLTLTHWQTLVGVDSSVGYANRSASGPDADPFCPERWLEEQASATQVEQYSFTHTFIIANIPDQLSSACEQWLISVLDFGRGPRAC